MNKGKSAKYPELEEQIYRWIQELHSEQKPVTHTIVQIKAKTLSQQSPYIIHYPGITESKFSNKWVDGFITHYKLSHRHRTTVAQKLLEDLQLQQQEFLSFVLYHRIQFNYPLTLIGNMDETPLLFDLPNNTTIDNCGTNIVSIWTCRHEIIFYCYSYLFSR